MGVDTNLHIGPYLVIESNNKVLEKHAVRSCSNKDCKNRKSKPPVLLNSNFCPECSHVVANVEYESEEYLDAYDLLEEHDLINDLSCTDYETGGSKMWVSNKRTPWNRNEDEEMDLSEVDRDAEKTWFIQTHRKALDILSAAFGSENIKIKWGFIKWYS